MGGTVDGKRGDHVLLAPPFICTEQQIATIVERLDAAIGAALTKIGAPTAL
jgi:adenosylmethionine-8-amino-7-oxononanoate aminotransferase